MPYLLTIGGLLIAWTFLSLLGREREGRVQALQAQIRAKAATRERAVRSPDAAKSRN